MKGLVESHTVQVQKIETMMKNDFDRQAKEFEQRLEKRKRTRLSHSHSQPQINLEQMIASKKETTEISKTT